MAPLSLAAALALAAAGSCPLRAADGPAGFLAGRFKGSGLKVRLVADVTAIRPGGTFHLGLWIQHDPGYHTYWSNPGIAGVPTLLHPELPAGFTAGSMIYPPPDKVKMAGLNVHGYEHDILVALPVTAPKELSGPVTLKTKASWMCCRTTCNPGFAELSLTLPAAAAADPAPAAADTASAAQDPAPAAPDPASAALPDAEWKPRFDALLASQPPPAAGWVFTARKNGSAIDLTATPPAGLPLPEKPQFFSSDNLICSHPVQNWKSTGGAATVSLSLSDFPPRDPTRLRGLLHASGASLLPGAAAAWITLDVPIGPEEAKK